MAEGMVITGRGLLGAGLAISVFPDPLIGCLTSRKIITRKNEEMTPGRNDEDPRAMICRKQKARPDNNSPSVWTGELSADDKLQI